VLLRTLSKPTTPHQLIGLLSRGPLMFSLASPVVDCLFTPFADLSP
jgi:hypothetical protein